VRQRAGLVAVPVLALALWLVYGSGFVDYDALYALIWGDDLAGGHRPPDLDARHSPTSHPLSTALSAPVSLLGDGALGALQAISIVSFAALGWAGYRLGERTFGPAAGALFALILLTRPLLVKQALSANVDIPFLALVLGAAAMEARAPRRGWPVLALLAVAGWLRPEAWLLALAYAAWLLWPRREAAGSGEAAAPGEAGPLRDRRRFALAALALAGPLGWALFDWVAAGDPLHSMNQTSSAAERIGRPRGVDRAVRLTPGYLFDSAGTVVAIGGAAAALLALRFARRRALLPVTLGALGGVGFLILGLGDQPLLARYLFVPATMLALLLAAGATAWWVPDLRAPRAALAAVSAAFAAAALAGVALAIDDADRWRDVSAHRHEADADLAELVDEPVAARSFDTCRPAVVAYFQTRPLLAYLLGDRRPNAIETTRPERAERGTLAIEAGDAARVPPGARPVAADRSWRVSCRR
jgi:hypothetical protein